MQRITPFLTFKRDGKKAVEFYCSVFKESSVDHINMMPGTDQLLHAGFTLDGQDFMAMDGGEYFEMREGQSLFVACKDQAEVDYYWEALAANGGEQGDCGWLTDSYGVSWQIIPTRLGELMGDPDHDISSRVMQAMLKMTKIDIAVLEAAAKGQTENTNLDIETTTPVDATSAPVDIVEAPAEPETFEPPEETAPEPPDETKPIETNKEIEPLSDTEESPEPANNEEPAASDDEAKDEDSKDTPKK